MSLKWGPNNSGYKNAQGFFGGIHTYAFFESLKK